MTYKVVPFVPALDPKKRPGDEAANQLSSIVNKNYEEGWEYVSLESVSSWVAADAGCFGFGGKPGYSTSRQMIVFKKRLE